MKALRLTQEFSGQVPRLSLDTVANPEVRPGHVMVKVKASAIQPSDRLNARGGFSNTTFPRTPGRDFSGVIVDGSYDRIGEEVFGTSGETLGFTADGPHAEYCLVPDEAAVKKPHNISHIQAATIGVPFTTALLCLTRARISKEDTVLILGANGAVGSAAVQIARILGSQTILRATRHDDGDINTYEDKALSKVSSWTEGKGVDVIVDTVGDTALMQAALNQIANRGRYAFIAAPRGSDIDPTFHLNLLRAYRKSIELIGCNSVDLTTSELNTALSVLKDWLDKGHLIPRGEDSIESVQLSHADVAYQTPSHRPCVVLM